MEQGLVSLPEIGEWRFESCCNEGGVSVLDAVSRALKLLLVPVTGWPTKRVMGDVMRVGWVVWLDRGETASFYAYFKYSAARLPTVCGRECRALRALQCELSPVYRRKRAWWCAGAWRC